ncbi:MAG: hypothetical protein N3E46_08855 [Gemmataceae bacterium]|nr:hypothetical protein [Gemmataceae bacterium]
MLQLLSKIPPMLQLPSPIGRWVGSATCGAVLLGLLLAEGTGKKSGRLLAENQPVAATKAAPAGAGPERLPVRLLAEAEDFTIKSGWEIVPYRENYFACTFAITFLSRMACLGAPEQLSPGQTAIAEQTIHVPYEDTYELLVRYEQPYDFSCEFTVEVEQKGKVAARWDCGRLQDPKIWAFNNHKREPMVRYSWSATDNIVWQHPGQVRLEGGAATLRLLATAQLEGGRPRRQAARRHVDVVCLTNDRAGMERQKKTGYLEFDGWLVQDGDLFLRITNPADAPAPVAVTLPPMQAQHSPYWVHVREWPTTLVLRQGRAVTETAYQLAGPRSQQVRSEHLAPLLPWPKVIPEEQYLRPGDRSAWVPLGQSCDALNTGQWAAQVQYFRPSAKGQPPKGGKPRDSQEVYLRYEFGIPDGQGGIRVIKDVTVRAPLAERTAYTFDIPGCVHPNPALANILKQRYWLPHIRTQKEALAYLLAEVKKFPPVGRVPERLLIYGISAGDTEEGRQLALALGDNTTVGGRGKKRGLIAHWGNTDLKWIEQQVTKRAGGLSDVLIVSYGDEIHLPADKMTDAEFAAWLQARGVQYDGPIRFTNDRNDPLFYYSQLAAKEKGGARYAAATAYYKTHGVLTGANYSPHANYLVSEIDYIRPFKLRAMSMPWTEDYAWQVAEFSPQVVGYLLSGLRAGAKYDRLPIHMYVMPHSPGQIPREFRQSFYCSIAHGAKIINYFTATPLSVAYTENYVDTEDLPMWRMIHRCTHEAGIFEDYVVDGWVRPGRVALLLSSVDELITGVNNFSLALHNNERKALYFALRHAQVPVDFLSEDDVIEGRAQDYAVIYVTQQYLHSRCLAALQKWVEAGGTLVALCGGGFRNEFQKDNPAAAALYGVESGPIQTDPALVPRYLQGNANAPFFPKQDLPRYEPWDYASWDGSLLRGKAEAGKAEAGKAGAGGQGDPHRRIEKVPVVAWKQALTVKTAQVAGRFRDGTPAVTVQRHGRGRAVLFAFLPGQAYLRSGLPLRPVDRGASPHSYAHFLPTQLDRHLRARLVEDFLPPDDARLRPVLVEAELVETTCIDTPALQGQPARLAIPLINWSGRPIPQLNVLIRDLPQVRRIRSVERGELQYTQTPEGLRLNVPLDVADMLLIDR